MRFPLVYAFPFQLISFFRYDGLQDKIHTIFSKSLNPTVIRAVSNIFRMAQEHDRRSGPTPLRGSGSSSTLSTVDEASTFSPGRTHLQALEEIGMAGIANNFVFLPPTGGHATRVIQWIPELLNLILLP